MQIDPKSHEPRRIYNLMTSVVVPRPIAWVSTVSPGGVVNLAPFSFFSGITSKPPLVSIAIGRRRGERKDTARNAASTGELVINFVSEASLEQMVATSGEYAPEVDELALAGLTPLASVLVAPPRVAEAPIQLECTTSQVLEVSPGIVDLVIAEVVMFHVADDLPIDEELLIPAAALQPVARLGGIEYALLGEIKRVRRPVV